MRFDINLSSALVMGPPVFRPRRPTLVRPAPPPSALDLPCEVQSVGRLAVSLWAAVMLVLATSIGLMWSWSGPAHGTVADQQLLAPQSVVVAADRFVCSMDGGQQSSAGILGQDGGSTVTVGGVVYWNFGDTTLVNGGMIPNNVAWSGDADAADCITLVPMSAEGGAASLLPRTPSELTVWPGGMEATSSDTVHFFYASVTGTGADSWQVEGVGLASFDAKTLTAKRAFGGRLPWPEGTPQPMRTFMDTDFVYILLGTAQQNWETDTILARVPADEMESLSAYEYWQPGDGRHQGYWVAGLWDPTTNSWKSGLSQIHPLWSQPGLHNGVQVSYNEFLGRWLAVYSSGFMTNISVRSAEKLTGPWDGTEAKLIDCQQYHPASTADFLCYSGAQQDAYTRDGGRTIYVSYSDGASYQVYLHELHLAAPISQWTDNRGRAVYTPDDLSRLPGELSDEGVTFYASDIPVAGFLPIHRWLNSDTGDIRYSAIAPNEGYVDLGVDFYAPADAAAANATNALYTPVYRWEQDGRSRYSPLNLQHDGYVQHELAFFAACPDGDGDGLSDCEESFLGTDMAVADTDGDGMSDGYELHTTGCHPLSFDDDRDGQSTVSELLQGSNPCVRGSESEVTGS